MEAVNNAFLQLETAIHTDFPVLAKQSFKSSTEFFSSFPNHEIRTLVCLEPSTVAKRIPHLSQIIKSLEIMITQVKNAVQELKTWIFETLHKSISSTQLQHGLEEGVLQILNIQREIMRIQEYHILSQNIPESPFRKYEIFLDKIEVLFALFHSLFLVYTLSSKELGDGFVSHFHESLTQQFASENDLSSTTKVQEKYLRWIPINKLLLRIHFLKEQFDKLRKEKESWLCEKELQFAIQKWDLVVKQIFSHFHQSLLENEKSSSSMDPNQTDWTCLKHFFQEHTNWKLKDVDHDIDFHFVTVKQYAQMCFRNICQLLSDFTLLEVIGDGNCFYRAVIKYLWPRCPPNSEAKYSLLLRKFLNSENFTPASTNTTTSDSSSRSAFSMKEFQNQAISQQTNPTPQSTMHSSTSGTSSNLNNQPQNVLQSTEDPYKEFVIEGVTDAKTMSREGVWADHLQVKKLTDFLGRPVWLVRFDDLHLRYDEQQNLLIPGDAYRIGHEQFGEENPIVLYFVPETHYEVLKKRVQLEVECKTIDDHLRNFPVLIESFFTNPKDSALSFATEIIAFLFELEREADSILEMYNSLYSMDWSQRSQCQESMCLRIDILKTQLLSFKEQLEEVGKPLSEVLATLPYAKLHKNIVDELVEEDFKLVEKWGQLVLERTSFQKVDGPLCDIYDQIHFCEQNKYSTWNKYTKKSNKPVSYCSSSSTNYTHSLSSHSYSYNPQNYDFYNTPTSLQTSALSSTTTGSHTKNPSTSFNFGQNSSEDLEDLILNLENVKKMNGDGPIIEKENATQEEWLDLLNKAKSLTIQHGTPSLKSVQTLFEVIPKTAVTKISFDHCFITKDLWEFVANKTVFPIQLQVLWLKFCSLPKGSDYESVEKENRSIAILSPTVRVK